MSIELKADHRFRILGMDCAEEVIALKRELVPLVGDERLLAFDLLQGKLTVTSARIDLAAEQIVQAVVQAGLKAEPWTDSSG